MRDPTATGRTLTVDDYMRWEEAQTVKHEFVRGEVYALSGVTLRHDAITLNMLVRLCAGLPSDSCRVHSSEVKVQPIEGVVYYPDLSVDCVRHSDDDVVVTEPCLVVEVTSNSTARVDRGEKLEHYRRSPSLRMYLIVDHRRRRVTCWRRSEGDEWAVTELTGTGTIHVPCPRTTLTLDDIYQGVEMPPLGVAEPDALAFI